MSRNSAESRKGIHLSGDRCVVCGWNKKNVKGEILVEGAHVRKGDFKLTADYDKEDNIIALCPNHHVEFDCGNIAIDPDRKVCLHINKDDEVANKKLIGKVDHIQRGYFDYHIKHVFKGNHHM